MTLFLSLSSYSHCGSCGEGTAEDHHAKGEDSTHHEHDHEHNEKKNSEEEKAEKSNSGN
jgi:hypothetical protein